MSCLAAGHVLCSLCWHRFTIMGANWVDGPSGAATHQAACLSEMKKLRYFFTQHDQVNLLSFVHVSAEAFGGRQLVYQRQKLPLERASLLFLRPYNATFKLSEFQGPGIRCNYPAEHVLACGNANPLGIASPMQ